MRPDAITPQHAYRYRDLVRQQHGATSANRDLEVLSHLLTTAVEWGAIARNQLRGQVHQLRTPPRDRLVEDWEIAAALSVASPLIAAYLRLKLMTGLRRGDLLSLRLTDLRDDGIHVTPRKTARSSGKRLIIAWDDAGELRGVVDQLQRLPPRRIGAAPLIVTRQGKPYIKPDGSCNGFDSLWQRYMDKVLRDTPVTDRFQERDLRAKVASDSATLAEASERLGHSDTAITRRVYRRKPVVVSPLLKTR
jgi:integrase